MSAHIVDIEDLRRYRAVRAKFDGLVLPDGIDSKEVEDQHPRDWPLILSETTRKQLVELFAGFGLDASGMTTTGELFGNWSYLHALQLGVESYRAAGKKHQDTWMGSMPQFRAAVVALVEERMDDLRALHVKFGTFAANAKAHTED